MQVDTDTIELRNAVDRALTRAVSSHVENYFWSLSHIETMEEVDRTTGDTVWDALKREVGNNAKRSD